jgi:hypothetical protein
VSHFMLTAVTEDGAGYDHSWGDRYEVHAGDYAEAAQKVLSLEGTKGSRPYARIVSAWVRRGISWIKLDPATGEEDES